MVSQVTRCVERWGVEGKYTLSEESLEVLPAYPSAPDLSRLAVGS